MNYDNLEDYYILNDKKIPILVIWGNKDIICNYENIHILEKILLNGKFITIENSGHSAINFKAKEISKYINDFINE